MWPKEEVYWLQNNIAMRKQYTANVCSQLGRRKNLKLPNRGALKFVKTIQCHKSINTF